MRRFEAEVHSYVDKEQLLLGLEHLAVYAPSTVWCKRDVERLEELRDKIEEHLSLIRNGNAGKQLQNPNS